MANSIAGPRKQRTRQHVIADLSVHYVEGFILEEGYTVRRLDSDYSYDLVMRTFDEAGYVEPGPVFFQVKASDALRTTGSDCVYDIDIRDYHLWMREELPVVLVLYDAARKKACWLCVQEYFDEDAARQPSKGAKTVRVRVPKRQVMNRAAVQKMRGLRYGLRRSKLGGQS